MTTLFLHIEYLLRKHDCVIVPTLGAFIISRRGACFDRETGVIIPPSANLTFNHSVSNNDGLLVSSIARRMGISYDEAMEILDETVAGMRAQLASDRELTIGTIGTLSLGAEDNIIFTPAVKEADRYGLHSVLLPRIAANADETAVASIEVSNRSDEAESRQEAPRMPERKFRTDKYYYIPVHKLFAKVGAVLMIMVVAVWTMLSFSPEVTDAPHRDCASVIPVVVESHPVTAPDTSAIKPTAAPDSVSKFHIVVATFNDSVKARLFMTKHADDGFDLRLVSSKRCHRVTADRSTDRNEMVAILRSERLDSCFHHSWIWEN